MTIHHVKGLLLAGLGGGCSSEGSNEHCEDTAVPSKWKWSSPVSLGGKAGLVIPMGGAGLGGRTGAPDLGGREGISGAVVRGVGTG